ncbi:MAG: hypothetical protein ACOY4U_07260, partial [Pseudomonadota bacterium]
CLETVTASSTLYLAVPVPITPSNPAKAQPTVPEQNYQQPSKPTPHSTHLTPLPIPEIGSRNSHFQISARPHEWPQLLKSSDL